MPDLGIGEAIAALGGGDLLAGLFGGGAAATGAAGAGAAGWFSLTRRIAKRDFLRLAMDL